MFDQSNLSDSERNFFLIFNFAISMVKTSSLCGWFDLGCGSGRWAILLLLKSRNFIVSILAERLMLQNNLACYSNCIFLNESDSMDSLPDSSMDFGYSLGVLHHVLSQSALVIAIVAQVRCTILTLPILCFNNRPPFFRLIWKISDMLRSVISRLPFNLRFIVSQLIAFFVYLHYLASLF